MRPIRGFGIVLSACNICASFAASADLTSGFASNCSRIQPRSPPAQKLLPSAAKTTTRTEASAPKSSAAECNSAIICADMALCFSGRDSHSVATPRASRSILIVSLIIPLPCQNSCKNFDKNFRKFLSPYPHGACHIRRLVQNSPVQPGLIAQRDQPVMYRFGRHIARGPRRIGTAAQTAHRRIEHPQATCDRHLDILKSTPGGIVKMPRQTIRWHHLKNRRKHGIHAPRTALSDGVPKAHFVTAHLEQLPGNASNLARGHLPVIGAVGDTGHIAAHRNTRSLRGLYNGHKTRKALLDRRVDIGARKPLRSRAENRHLISLGGLRPLKAPHI